MAVDVVLFGSHPDDIEWGAGGTLLLMRQRGISFALVDLTRGESGSRGTVEDRSEEARLAAVYVGANARENLGLPDSAIVDSPENRKHIARIIRHYAPSLVLAPYWEDRHPDHAANGQIVRNCGIYCASKKLTDAAPPHKPAAFLYYLLHNFRQPSFVVDISSVYQQKIDLLRIHRSQFSKTAEEFGVLPLGVSDYLFGLESRDRFLGSLAGARHGEGLIIDHPLKLSDITLILSLLGKTSKDESGSQV